ncbi:hypothetical protein WJX72_001971 [[Myrmecia] bisecta]|uniref:Rhodanese domain-containing protein n=1 Tax=[Myrmecia] bisecta TaxID=41462 RepID=A0AAW1Q898_9CHLO
MSSLVDSLPPEAQAALAAGADVAAKILAQATSSPAALAASSGVAIGVPVVLWWRARYGGYAGKLQPVDVFTMLQNEDAVLVDIRTDEQRFQDGVVELKRAARDRGAVIPISRLEAALARQLRRADEVAFDIAAAQIAGLRQVTSRTKIIIMGEGEERAVKVARALRTVASRSAYVMQGGFSAWYREQLPLKYGAVDYSSSAGDYLADEAEVIAEKTTSLLSRLRDPPTAVLTAAALTLSGYTIYDIHSTLRFVGVAGMLLTLANRASRYDSPQDALDDLQGAYARVAGLLPGTRTRRPAVQPMMLDADDNAEDFGEEAEPQPVSSSSSPPSQKPVSNGV